LIGSAKPLSHITTSSAASHQIISFIISVILFFFCEAEADGIISQDGN
jgi:hypothetical protein